MLSKDRARRYHLAGRLADILSLFSLKSRPGHDLHLDWSAMRRVGILCQWGLGDAVLTTPLLRALRRVTAANLELIGKPWLRELFPIHGLCDQVHELVPPWTQTKHKYRLWQPVWVRYARQLTNLWSSSFDLLIGLRYDPREIIQMRMIRAELRAGYGACGGHGWLDIDLGINPSLARLAHVAQDASFAAAILTGINQDPRPVLDVPRNISLPVASWLVARGYQRGLVLTVAPGAGHPIRRWPSRRFTAALKDLPDSIGFVVVIKPEEDTAAPDILWPRHIPGAIWQGSLEELQGLLSLSDILVSADSGVMHLGAACGSRIIGIFGPQLAQWFGPHPPSGEVVMVEPMSCRPCFDNCIFDQPKCMINIDESDVTSAIFSAGKQLREPRIARIIN
ncbi:MAG: glycosyltransferase family 9 protein [Deltaproteobacteria bacterium]|nr:glycosyltransferase family 9 protein [Deltaproteobacteria bacterium]